MNAGSGRRVDAVAVDGEAQLEVPSRFAPGTEYCMVSFKFRRGKLLHNKPVILEIKDKDKTVIVLEEDLGDEGDREDVYEWDGKDTDGNLVTPQKSPYTITLKIGKIITRTKKIQVEIGSLQIGLVNDAPRMYMNNPDQEIAVEAIIKLKRTNGRLTKSAVPQEVKWSFARNSKNMSRKKSFEYDSSSHKRLSKKKTDIHWSTHRFSSSKSKDDYKKTCYSVSVGDGLNLGRAFINFKPSGVGGDIYTLKGEIFADSKKKKLIQLECAPMQVWRSIKFSNVYTMHDETFLDVATTRANIASAFERKAYVKYSRDSVEKLGDNLSVKYIGLYKSGGGSYDWPADYSPSNLEDSDNQIQPTAQELTDYAYVGINAARLIAKNNAKTAIQNKAALWFNAIVDTYRESVNNWFIDADIDDSENALLAVKYYHPKLSAQGTDGATNFWPAGIEVNLANPGSGLVMNRNPDISTWRQVLGFNRGKISVIFKNYSSDAQLIATCRHEIGHGTKSVFKRDIFGEGDHSPTGLMTAYSGSSEFSNTCIQILRGGHR